MARAVIFNADDFGAAPGINHGIVHGHTTGVVTSTSLLVEAAAAQEAALLARSHPRLAVGLHWNLDATPLDDVAVVRSELERQLVLFERLLGRSPTHLDSHHHAHRRPEVEPLACEIAARCGTALRGLSAVHYIGGFYAQWETGVDDLEHVGVAALTAILATELHDDWTEIGCHPGFVDEHLHSSYREPRAAELATLTEPAIAAAIDELGLRLVSFADVPPPAS